MTKQLSLLDYINPPKLVKSEIIKKKLTTKGIIYLTIKSASLFEAGSVPARYRLIVKSSRKFFYCSPTIKRGDSAALISSRRKAEEVYFYADIQGGDFIYSSSF